LADLSRPEKKIRRRRWGATERKADDDFYFAVSPLLDGAGARKISARARLVVFFETARRGAIYRLIPICSKSRKNRPTSVNFRWRNFYYFDLSNNRILGIVSASLKISAQLFQGFLESWTQKARKNCKSLISLSRFEIFKFLFWSEATFNMIVDNSGHQSTD
jgi:hypothetical protein